MTDSTIYSFVVFTGTDMFSVRQSIRALMEAFPAARIVVLQHSPQKSVQQLIKSQQRNFKRHGWRWIPYQGLEIVDRLGSKLRGSAEDCAPQVGIDFEKSALIDNPRVNWQIFCSIHDPQALALVASVNPDLGISLAAPILKPALFEIPKLGTLNVHKGKVPDYKGMPPAFWELKAGEKNVGCTVHFVSEKLDGGDVVSEALVRVPPFATVKGMQLLLDPVGVRLVTEAAGDVLARRTLAKKQPTGGQTNTRPPLATERELNRKLAIRTGKRSDIATRGKDAVFKTYGSAYAPMRDIVRSSAASQHVIVLLYHRINDDLRDGVTNGIEQFDRHMAMLAKHTEVLRLSDLLDPAKRLGSSAKPKVIVTFDDGYEDNYSIAAPILERHGVHATFFVSTGLMGTNRGFEHDLSKLGRALPNMTWDQIRNLQRRGFEIGSHTVNHARISTLSSEQLQMELLDSKATIERELGVNVRLFAYPFGGVDDSSTKANSAVFAAGYEMCCSAYGGRNDSIDLKNIKRSTIGFAHSDAAFWAIVRGFSKVRGRDEKALYEA